MVAFFLVMMGLLPQITSMTIPSHFVPQIHTAKNHPADSDLPVIYHQGTVEKIAVEEYESIDEALTALNNGEADIFGHPINASDYALVDSYPNIKKQWAYENWIYTLTINTQFYPMENVYLRRAIAYGISKLDIAEDTMNNTVEPVDFATPITNEYSIERGEGGRYYEHDLANATDMLASAGMLDVDDDALVEAPNGSELCIELWYPNDVPGLIDTALLISNNLLDIGINNTPIGMSKSILQSEIKNHNQTYNLALYHQELPPYSLQWISTTFKDENLFVPGENIANIDNSQLNDIAEEYEDNLELSQAGRIGQNAMRAVRDLCPVVPLFEEQWLSVYSDANFDGWMNETKSGSFSNWNPVSVQSTGSRNELRIAVLPSFFNEFFVSTNPFESSSLIDHNWIARDCFNPYMLVLDSPIATLPNGYAVPRHAVFWEMRFLGQIPDINSSQARARYYLDSSANWTDGEQINGQDYSFTYSYYSNYSLVENAEMIDSVKVSGNFKAGVTYNAKDIFAYRKLGELPILPRHVIEGKPPNDWNLSIESFVGSGPYMISSFTPGESLELERNANYYPRVDTEPPVLRSKTLVPDNPIPTESVLIRVIIGDESRITNVTLEFTYEVGTLNFTESKSMIETPSGFEGTIPARATATSVFYEIRAIDSWGNSAIVLKGSYTRTTGSDSDGLQPGLLIAITIVGVIAVTVMAVALKRRR
jgi:ABC-type transport system substrate-binding protein